MILLLSAMMLAGMQTAPVRIELSSMGNNCILRVEDKALLEADLVERARGWARRKQPVVLAVDVLTSYRCIGGTLYALQSAGVIAADGTGHEKLVKLAVPAGTCAASVDGQRVSLNELEGLFSRWERDGTLVDFQPAPAAEASCVTAIFDRWERHRGVKLGFTGNEATEGAQ